MLSNEDFVHELIKNVDSEELFSSFIIEMPRELTDAEKAVKRELGLLRRLRRTLTDINQIKKEEKPKAIRPGEKAKEEAMKLLRSGVISIADKSERHLGRRKSKDHEDDDSVSNSAPHNTATSAPITQLKKSTLKSKAFPYKSFLRGDTLYPLSHANSPDIKPSPFSAHRDTASGDTVVVRQSSLSTATPVDSQNEALAVAAASKRKQQLIALMTSEEEDVDEAATAVDNLGGGDTDSDAKRDDVSSLESGGISLTDGGEQQHRQRYRSSMMEAGVTLHVGYHNVTEDVIRDLLGPFGTILRIKVSDQQTHAYVTMATREMAEKALDLDHQMVNNRLLRVTLARKQFPPAPYRRADDDRRPRFPPKNQSDRWHHLAAPPSLDNASLDDVPSGGGSSTGQVTGQSAAAQSRDLVGYADLFPES